MQLKTIIINVLHPKNVLVQAILIMFDSIYKTWPPTVTLVKIRSNIIGDFKENIAKFYGKLIWWSHIMVHETDKMHSYDNLVKMNNWCKKNWRSPIQNKVFIRSDGLIFKPLDDITTASCETLEYNKTCISKSLVVIWYVLFSIMIGFTVN